MTRTLRVATVGAGYFSRFHYDAWSRIGEVELVAVCDRAPEAAQAIAKTHAIEQVFSDFTEMLAAVSPDLVDIITPPDTHLGFIRQAAARGIDMICQKPFCRSIEEAQEAARFAAEQSAMLAVHENFRFQPWYRKIKTFLDSGRLGQIYGVQFRLRPGDGQGADAYLARQPYFQTMRRFLLRETGVHHVDVFRFLLGEPESVYADLRRLNPAIAGEDAGHVILVFPGGARALYDGNRLADHAAENRRLTMGEMVIDGSEAVLRLDGDGRLFVRDHGHNAEESVDYAWSDRGFGGDCVHAFQRHVVDHLLDAAPLETAAADYLKNLVIVEAAYRADESGCAIRIA
jgi:predicted dehydrogenase